MSSKIDWKQKYQELRSKYLNAVDVAFRLGVQEGMRNAEIQQLQTQLQEAQAQAQAAMAAASQPPMGADGAPVDEQGMPVDEQGMPVEEEMVDANEGEGDELDQSINELEGLVKKEKKINVTQLMKSIHKSNKTVKPEDSEKQKKIEELIKKM
jgi:uncharacterized protein involved in exopolysaccharide biosynthesis